MAAPFLFGYDLRRFFTVYRNDEPQEPAPYARVELYRQGATVTSGLTPISNGQSAQVTVSGVGRLADNDTVSVRMRGPSLTVTAVSGGSRGIHLEDCINIPNQQQPRASSRHPALPMRESPRFSMGVSSLYERRS